MNIMKIGKNFSLSWYQGKAAILGKKKGNDEDGGGGEGEHGDDKLLKKAHKLLYTKSPSVSTYQYWKTKYSGISSKDDILEYVIQGRINKRIRFLELFCERRYRKLWIRVDNLISLFQFNFKSWEGCGLL